MGNPKHRGRRPTRTEVPLSFSIIVPVFNESAIIAAALGALARFRQQGAEIIVVDGQSGDDTAALAAPHADLVIASGRGRAVQMNAGAARARGAVLVFLHVDTELPADALVAITAALGSVCGAAQGDPHDPGSRSTGDRVRARATLPGAREMAPASVWGRFDVKIAGRAALLKLVAALMNRRSRWTGIATGDQAIFVTRRAFAAAGGYPEQPLMEDIELCRRLSRMGRPACLRHRVITSGRRWESRGIWRTILLMWRLRLLYWLGAAPDRVARSYR